MLMVAFSRIGGESLTFNQGPNFRMESCVLFLKGDPPPSTPVLLMSLLSALIFPPLMSHNFILIPD